jgi:lincosamide nucleotidyltransferase A/C/D/E
MTEMTGRDVSRFLDLVDEHQVRIWLDGGWAVDACLGRQTRQHDDLDIVIEEKDLDLISDSLRARGYGPAHRNDTRPWNFALGDRAGHEIDFHVIVLNEAGDGIYGPPEDGERYPAASLTGFGSVGGRAVHCISPEWLVRFHSGYELDDNDRADVLALCSKFGIPLPAEYR